MGKKWKGTLLGLVFFILLAPLSTGLGFEATPGPDERVSAESPSNTDHIRLAQTVGPVSPGGPETGAAAAEAQPEQDVSDVLEPYNRAIFKFNDKLYFWVLKPASQGYKAVVPEPARVGVRNFFYNIAFPVRFVNCLLQGKVAGAADEFGKFMVNSVFGVAGFLNVVPKEMKRHDEDFGQTLGFYGLGPGFYIVWPFLGPSSARDSVGKAGDVFLDPVNWAVSDIYINVGVKAYQTVNETSLSIGDYEALKRAALDPYVALRSAFYQNRLSLIKD